MKKLLVALAVLVPAAASARQDGNNQRPRPLPGWHETLHEGLKDAESTGKPLMVVFR